ncbi:acetyl-CoA carboxylase biotin carboxyl carrier protein [Pseudomonas sp. CR3202]|uniref:acetyl-CoA carboxylase biotin carboxyl carrier protein n=1 Tax=Pseudomonas sp. CR3202 TaxID=3351532 RepID=UPI003BF03AAA
MTPKMIEEIASLLNRRGLEAIEFEQGNAALRMVRGAKGPSNVIHAPAPEAAEAVAKAMICHSPGMGFLRLIHPQREAPNVAVGDHVGDGETLAYLQCGALLREVTANCSGTVKQLLAVEGELVGFGQPLFEFE